MHPTTDIKDTTTFCCSLFRSVQDTTPKPLETVSFAEFADALVGEHEIRDAKDGECFSLATFRAGSVRARSNVERVYALGLDLDHITPSQRDEALRALDPYEYAAYTTFQHEPEKPRIRVIVSLSRPVSADEYDQLWTYMNNVLGGVCDANAKDAPRVFYAPSAPAPDHTWRDHHAVTTAGAKALPLDVDAIMVSAHAAGRAHRSEPPPLDADEVSDGTKRITLETLRERCRRAKSENRELMNRLFNGESLAREGGRDDAVLRAASTLAFVAPEASVDALAEIFVPSLAVMQAEANNPANPSPTRADVRAKLERAVERARSERTRRAGARAAELAALIAEARGGCPDPYTDDDIARFAARVRATEREFQRRWIIQKGGAFYVNVDGVYRPPLEKDSIDASLHRDLAPAAKFVRLVKVKQDGGVSPLNRAEIMRRYGTVARALVASLSLRESYYDAATQTFYEAACPPRSDLQPLFVPEIDEWLRLLGGTESEKLLDWIATILDLEKQTAAVYLEGAAGSGKTMLTSGLSKLWNKHGQPTELNRILDDFNADLLSCPLVVADENIYGRRRSAELRTLIGTNSRTLSRKHLPNAPLIGCIRLMLTANNDKLLGMNNEELSADDIAAISERFIHVSVPRVAAEYLRKLGGRAATAKWVDGDLIAQHALWLRENRKVVPGDRFLVHGSPSSMVRALATKPATAALVTEFLANALMRPQILVQTGNSRAVVVGDGDLLANAQAMALAWQLFLDPRRRPATPEIANALVNLSDGERQLGPKGDRVRYRRIRPDFVLDWAAKNGFGDLDAMQERIASPRTPVPPSARNLRADGAPQHASAPAPTAGTLLSKLRDARPDASLVGPQSNG